MISWLEFLTLSLLIAWSEALADKGAWNFREMRVELIYQLGSSFCVITGEMEGILHEIFFLPFKKILPTPVCSPPWTTACSSPAWVDPGLWWAAAWGLKEGPACRWGPSVPLGWWQEHLGPKERLIKLHFQVEHAVSAGHRISIFKIFLRLIFRFPRSTWDRFLLVSSLDALMASRNALCSYSSSRGCIPPYSKSLPIPSLMFQSDSEVNWRPSVGSQPGVSHTSV